MSQVPMGQGDVGVRHRPVEASWKSDTLSALISLAKSGHMTLTSGAERYIPPLYLEGEPEVVVKITNDH